MVEKNVLKTICEFLVKKRESEPRLAPKLSDQAAQKYVHFCENIDDREDAVPCPLCFLTKGRIQYLLPPRPFQITTTTTHESQLICEFCYERIPIGANA